MADQPPVLDMCCSGMTVVALEMLIDILNKQGRCTIVNCAHSSTMQLGAELIHIHKDKV